MVAPFTGAWIEMTTRSSCQANTTVAPFTGAWIEIPGKLCSWCPLVVAPFTGAWIEIEDMAGGARHQFVAPFTGAWIEIRWFCRPGWSPWSLPSRERGLKSYQRRGNGRVRKSLPSRERGLKSSAASWCRAWAPVAPFTGAWIEMHSPPS